MNPPSPNNPREQMEVRIVAFLLGEASPFETAELEAALASDPQLAAFHDEMKRTIGLVQETTTHFKPVAQPTQASQPKLSPERREKLLKTFKVIAPAELAQPPTPRFHWSVTLKIAAALVGLLALAALFLPALSRTKAKATRLSEVTLGFRGNEESKFRWDFMSKKESAASAKSAEPPAPIALSVGLPPPPAPSVVPPPPALNPAPDANAQPYTLTVSESAPRPARQPVFMPAQLADTDGDNRKIVELFDSTAAPIAGRSSLAAGNRGESAPVVNAGSFTVANGTAAIPPAVAYHWGEQPAASTPTSDGSATVADGRLSKGLFDDNAPSSKRQAIQDKLKNIKLDSVHYENLPLSEVVKNLSEEAKRRDPEGKGINFMLSSRADQTSGRPGATVDPSTGLPAGGSPQADIAGVGVKMSPTAGGTTLAATLDTIANSTETPVKLSVEDYGVVITPVPPLVTPPSPSFADGPASATTTAPLPAAQPPPQKPAPAAPEISGYVNTSAMWQRGSGPASATPPAKTAEKVDGYNLNVVNLEIEKPLDASSSWAGTTKQSAQQHAAYGFEPAKPAPADESTRLARRLSASVANDRKAGVTAGDTVTFDYDTSGGLGGGGGRSTGGQAASFGGQAKVAPLGTDLYFNSDATVAPKPAVTPARPAARPEILFGSSRDARNQELIRADSEREERRAEAQAGQNFYGRFATPALGDTPVVGEGFKKAAPQSSIHGPAAAEPVAEAGLELEKSLQVAREFDDLNRNGRVDGNGVATTGGAIIVGGNANQITSGSGTLALGVQKDATWSIKQNPQSANDFVRYRTTRGLQGQGQANGLDLQSAGRIDKLAKLETAGESTRSRGGESLAWFAQLGTEAKTESAERQLAEKSAAKDGETQARSAFVQSLAGNIVMGKPAATALAMDGSELAKSMEEGEGAVLHPENKPVSAEGLTQIVLPGATDGNAALGPIQNSPIPLPKLRLLQNTEAKAEASKPEVAKNESAKGDPKIPIRYSLATDISSTLAGLGNQSKIDYLAPQPDASYRLKLKAEADAKGSKPQVVSGAVSADSDLAVPALQVMVTNVAVAWNKQDEEAKNTAIEESIERRPYFHKKRDLENLQVLREKLNMQIIAQEIDSKIPKSMIVEVVDTAEPQQAKSSWLRGLFGGDKYESTARIQVEKDIPDVQALLGERPLSGMAGGYDPYWLQTETEKIQSKAVLGKVIERLNLNEAWAGKFGEQKLSPEVTYQLLKEKLDVHQSRGTSTIDIGVRGDKPGEAAQIANKIAEVYRETRRQQRQEVTAQGVEVLKQQWAEQDKKVKEKQAEVAQLEKQLGAQQPSAATPKPVSAAEVDRPAVRPSTPPATPQPEILARENAFSTFSLNVSDVSFKLAAASLQNGVIPDPGSIRVEEFVNAFHYRDPAPAPGARIGFAWERARYPFAHNRDILRLGVQTAARGREAQKPLNLVIALDNSGSMERPDRVAILREALKVLAAQLRPQDRISVIAFSRTARLWVDGMAGGNVQEFLGKVLDLNPEGGTNLEDAMNLAYATATKHFMAQGVNRVILLTDGAANLGNVEPEDLKKTVVAQRQRGIALDCFGIGWEGYDDDFLEILSRNGDGRYGFLNEPEQAGPEFADQLAGALNVAAADVKTQVEFNPQRVTSWRQIGYAKHQLKKEQFRDNTVDAAEIAAAEQGNALYVIETNPNGAGPIGVVRVRFKVPETGEYVEQEWPLAYVPRVPALEQSSPAMRLAVTASAFGEWLSTSPFAAEVKLPALQATLAGVPQIFAPDPRPQQLATMLQQARSATGK